MTTKKTKILLLTAMSVFLFPVISTWFAANIILENQSWSENEVFSNKSTFDSRAIVAFLKDVGNGIASDLKIAFNDTISELRSDLLGNKKDESFSTNSKLALSNLFDFSVFNNSDTETYLADIVWNENEKYIRILANDEIINPKAKNFFPENHTRINEVIKMILNSYVEKSWDEIDFGDNNWSFENVPDYYQKAHDLGLLNGVWDNHKFDRIVYYEDVKKVFQNFESNFDVMIYIWALENFEWAITRWDFARNIVNIFALQEENVEEDADFISILESRWILDWINLNHKNLTRAEFIQTLAKAILRYQWEEDNLSRVWIEIYFTDLDYNSDLVAYVDFAKSLWLIDYLEETVKMEKYFNPNSFITEDEMNYTFNLISDSNFDLWSHKFVDKMDYLELLVSVFEFEEESNKVWVLNW